MALAARLPKLCTAANSPNADPRSSTGRQGGNSGVLGRLQTADGHPGSYEPGGQG